MLADRTLNHTIGIGQASGNFNHASTAAMATVHAAPSASARLRTQLDSTIASILSTLRLPEALREIPAVGRTVPSYQFRVCAMPSNSGKI
jgi:hypothetical protein